MIKFDSVENVLTLKPGHGFRDRQSEKIFCDGKLRADGRTYDVHKCVVGVASDFLGKAFVSEVFRKFSLIIQKRRHANVFLEIQNFNLL